MKSSTITKNTPTSNKHPDRFQHTLLTWFDLHGRKQLPWQFNKTPYRVWVSEIMLQQTQVATVIPYYERFMQRFPDLAALANAHEDEVLHLWAGLGYYSRARNLHRAAKMVMTEFKGEFPSSIEALKHLPGIGQSTAGAILSIAFNQRAPILDGNVKRVLTRLHGIIDPVTDKHVENQLWNLANEYTPTARVADYTQAMMDLGATLCTRSKPQCATCPFTNDCEAYQQGITHLVPAKKAGKEIPTKQATFLVIQYQDSVLLQKRPATGIWGGLWSLPELSGEIEIQEALDYCQQKLKVTPLDHRALAPFRHTFSHYHLDIFPIVIIAKKVPLKVMADDLQIWYNLRHPESIGLPKPIQSILRGL